MRNTTRLLAELKTW